MTKGEKIAIYTGLIALASTRGAGELISGPLKTLGEELGLESEPLGRIVEPVVKRLVALIEEEL